MTQEREDPEAGTDEVAALAVALAHVPAPRTAALEDDEDDVLGDHDAGDLGQATVLPRQRDEVTCTRCYLVVHVSRAVDGICGDCR